jgi:hypothetical protein
MVVRWISCETGKTPTKNVAWILKSLHVHKAMAKFGPETVLPEGSVRISL